MLPLASNTSAFDAVAVPDADRAAPTSSPATVNDVVATIIKIGD